MFKVDFEKAYDLVSWVFLDYMLQRMGFCHKWRHWMSACLKSASISILINDSPTKEFAPTRGLRQGDPLAPLLFNIVGEGITGLMREAVQKNLYRSYMAGKKKEPINILQYVDDTVFVGEAEWENVIVLKAMLRGFELASGLKINYAKSQFGIIGGRVNWVNQAAQILKCRQLQTPFCYLGIPIGAKPSSNMVWEPLISKYESKLSKWAQKNISMAGKVTLINSVLNALPIYLLSFFKIPQKVAHRLVTLQRNFLWGGDKDYKKIPWVKWETICLPKEEGGLGIKEISKFNEALLGKWIWDLASDQQQLWARIIKSKYGGWEELQSSRDRRGCSHWWRDLRKIYHNSGQSLFQQNLVWKPDGGDRIHFWTDRWLGEDCTLKQKYNSLFLISRQQHSIISQMGNFSEDGWRWDLNWRRNLFDHESVLAVNFMEDITSISIQRNVKDTMVWKAESTGVYSTRSAYRMMLNVNASASDVRIFKLIWKMNIPPRAATFTWRLLKDRLPTKGNLLRRNVITQDVDCPLCGQVQEEVGHLFFNCQRTLPLW